MLFFHLQWQPAPFSEYAVFSQFSVYMSYERWHIQMAHAEEQSLESDCLGPITVLTLNRI